MSKACEIINNNINQLLNGRDLLSIKKIDEILLNFQRQENWTQYSATCTGENVITPCSEALFLAYGACINQTDPYLPIYYNLKQREYPSNEKTPKLMFTVFNGGKALGSKVKFSRFYLILDIAP